MHTSQRTKIKQLYNLVAIARADGYVRTTELKLLTAISRKLGLEDAILGSLLKGSLPPVRLHVENIEDKISYLKDCVSVAVVDGSLHKEEYKFCKRICQALKIDNNVLTELLTSNEIKIE